jgi:transcription initiation factor TFIIIB Brf1 subunit/transcription initiation factor TFIIB
LGLQSSLRKSLPKLKKRKQKKRPQSKFRLKRLQLLLPKFLKESIDYIIRHASGKGLSQEKKREAQHYAQKLKYPKGALVFNGSGEEYFLYCLRIIKRYPFVGR